MKFKSKLRIDSNWIPLNGEIYESEDDDDFIVNPLIDDNWVEEKTKYYSRAENP